MNKLILVLVVLATFLLQTATAQIVNGSFETGDFTGYTTAGSAAVLTGGAQNINGQVATLPAPPNGTFQAFIQSTGTASVGQGVSGATLDGFLGTTTLTAGATTGQAIKQTFTTASNGTLTFSYAYQSRETVNSGFDNTGYVLRSGASAGTVVTLVNSNTAGVSNANSAGGVFVDGLPYQTLTLNLAAGTYTLGFVAYNTDNVSTTALLVDNITFTALALGSTPGLTSNQKSTATYVDAFGGTITGGSFGALVGNLMGLANSPSALASALDEISPKSLQVFRHIAFDNATFNTQDVTNHLANLRDGLTGFDGSQLTVTDASLAPTLAQINSRLLAWNPAATPGLINDTVDPVLGGVDMKDMKRMTPAASEPADRWSTFIAGSVILADLSHEQDLAYQNYTTSSVMLGADYRLDEHFTVGALLTYGHTDANLDHIGSSATVDTYSPGVYASYVDGGWYGNGLFSYGYNSYTEDRNIAIGSLDGTNHGAPQGNQYVGNLTGGYEFKRGNFKFGPIAGLQYVNLGINSFSEQGPTALNIQSESDESFRSQLGVEARYAARFGTILLTPHVSATWQHEFLDGSHGITSQFNQVGAGSFLVETSPTENDSAFIDAGLNADVVKDVTLFADYQTQVGQDDFFAQSVQAGVKVSF